MNDCMNYYKQTNKCLTGSQICRHNHPGDKHFPLFCNVRALSAQGIMTGVHYTAVIFKTFEEITEICFMLSSLRPSFVSLYFPFEVLSILKFG